MEDTPKYKKVWEAKAGEFYDKEHYNTIIKESSYGLDEEGNILFCFIKDAIKKENRQKYKDIINKYNIFASPDAPSATQTFQ